MTVRSLPLLVLAGSAGFLHAQNSPDAVRPQPVRPPVGAISLQMCPSNQLSLATDGENGAFDGMSHSGVLLVLRNIGSTPCRVDPFPKITLLSGSKVLEARGEVTGARFMHPGPVVLPVVVAPGAEVTSTLRWVSGEVYSKSVCVQPDALAVELPAGRQQVAFSAHVCGEAGKGVTYEMTRFVTDPVYSGK